MEVNRKQTRGSNFQRVKEQEIAAATRESKRSEAYATRNNQEADEADGTLFPFCPVFDLNLIIDREREGEANSH